MYECVTELFAHCTVENKINSVVDQRQNIEQVTESHVNFFDEMIENSIEKVDDSLWKLSRIPSG